MKLTIQAPKKRKLTISPATWVASQTSQIADANLISKDAMYKVFYCRLEILTTNVLQPLEDALGWLAPAMAVNPETTILILTAPSCGRYGNEFNETARLEHVQQVENELRKMQHSLNVKSVMIKWDGTSIHGSPGEVNMYNILLQSYFVYTSYVLYIYIMYILSIYT